MINNNYYFWNDYLHRTSKKIEELLLSKEKIYADFHIHTDYSADGKQTLEDIINRANSLGLDIIAVTDHDNIDVYDDLFELIKSGQEIKPIIVPGVEFTVENPEYGSQCHILQLFINPKEKDICADIKHNKDAAWIRVQKQFKRISENKTLQYFFKRCDIKCSIDRYKRYLATLRRPIPEYTTLLDYLMSILYEKGITTWDVFHKLEEYNKEDTCEERRNMKAKRYEVLWEKYSKKGDVDFNTRFLLSLLAVKGVDDDYFPEYESCGSLSVNNYDELKYENLNHSHLTIFAHPNENTLPYMNKAFKVNSNMCGMEFNKQSKYSDDKLFFDKAKELDAIVIRGSDSHSKDSEWYDDMEFYVADKEMLRRLVKKSYEYISIGLDKDKVDLKEYTPKWKELFSMEYERLSNLIGDKVIKIEHVGSTSIPGLKAKPILDVAVCMENLDDAMKFKDILLENGYNFRDDGGVKGEYLFSIGKEDYRCSYIHCVSEDSKRWHDYITFKDYLNNHPEAVEEYSELKENLANTYKDERKKYTAAKDEFISRILGGAL